MDIQKYIEFDTPPGTDQDCDFLEQIIRVDGVTTSTLLDLACGVGRHALPMATRGFDSTGIHLSPERIAFAAVEATRLGITNFIFMVADLRDFRMTGTYNYVYSLFNTFSLFTENNDLIKVLQNVHHALEDGGKLVIQVGSLWPYIAEGNFKNSDCERTDPRENLTQKQAGSIRVAQQNNIYRHHRTTQYIREGFAYPTREETFVQMIFSINEWDLLCRLTGFKIHCVLSRMDLSASVKSFVSYEGTSQDRDLILILLKTA
jgi:SAM-dependent methyltransferase